VELLPLCLCLKLTLTVGQNSSGGGGGEMTYKVSSETLSCYSLTPTQGTVKFDSMSMLLCFSALVVQTCLHIVQCCCQDLSKELETKALRSRDRDLGTSTSIYIKQSEKTQTSSKPIMQCFFLKESTLKQLHNCSNCCPCPYFHYY